jgi:hypothetical protein
MGLGTDSKIRTAGPISGKMMVCFGLGSTGTALFSPWTRTDQCSFAPGKPSKWFVSCGVTVWNAFIGLCNRLKIGAVATLWAVVCNKNLLPTKAIYSNFGVVNREEIGTWSMKIKKSTIALQSQNGFGLAWYLFLGWYQDPTKQIRIYSEAFREKRGIFVALVTVTIFGVPRGRFWASYTLCLQCSGVFFMSK